MTHVENVMLWYHCSEINFFSENHIYEDVNRCVEAVQEKDFRKLTKLGAAVRGRIARADHVVLTEMENYESGPYIEAVTRAVLVMRNNSEFELCNYSF